MSRPSWPRSAKFSAGGRGLLGDGHLRHVLGTAAGLARGTRPAGGLRAGRTVNRLTGAYRGEAKTDARDAHGIAETARQRRNVATIDVPAQLAADLALLTAHRSDLVADRVRMINGP